MNCLEAHASPGEIPLQEQAPSCPSTGSLLHWSQDCERIREGPYALRPGSPLGNVLLVVGCLLPPILWIAGPIVAVSPMVHPEVRVRFFYATVVSVAVAGALALATTIAGIIMYAHTAPAT